MLIIPVIDLCKGIVVHAIQGNRKEYRPIDSKICLSPAPLDVISGFLEIFNFKSIYIADLDALEHQGENAKFVESICKKFPNIEFWLDTGTSYIDRYLQNPYFKNLRLILSSESMTSVASFTSYLKNYPQHHFILSLDYKDGSLLGPQELLQFTQQWPKDVIVLNLDNVGAEQGCNIPEKLNKNISAKDFQIYYGGGVRHADDIIDLKSKNISGALVSTALHKQIITSDDLHFLSQ